MKLSIAAIEAVLAAETGIRKHLPPTATCTGAAVRDRIEKLDNHQLADLARWVQGLSDAARVLRSVEFDMTRAE